MVSNPGTYSLLGNQCTSVAANAIIGAGVPLQQSSMRFGGSIPMSTWALSPSGFKSNLTSDVNKPIVTGQRRYGGR